MQRRLLHLAWIIPASVVLLSLPILRPAWRFVVTAADNNEGMAAWVQGVFSVAAIGAAIWIERSSANRDALARREAEKAVLAACSRLVTLFTIKTQAFYDGRKLERDDCKVGQAVLSGFEGLASAIRSFPIASLPTPAAVVHYVGAMEVADDVVLLVRELERMAIDGPPAGIQRMLAFAVEHLEPLLDQLKAEDLALRAIAGV